MKKGYANILHWLAIIVLLYACNGNGEGNGDLASAQSGEIQLVQGRVEPQELFSNLYNPVSYIAAPGIQPYTIPLDPSNIDNLEHVLNRLNLTDPPSHLLENGFAVIQGLAGDQVGEFYKRLRSLDIPIFISSDSLLHLYHVLFDYSLMRVEEEQFAPAVRALSQAMMDEINRRRTQWTGELAEAGRLAAAFFAVSLRCMDPQANVPSDLAADVAGELSLMDAHAGFSPSPLFGYNEDYSQYIPRGHYERTETLKRYFRAMMWWGRLGFLLKPQLVSAQQARVQTLAALLIAGVMDMITIDGERASDVWHRVYTVTTFFVGLADDLTVRDYHDALLTVMGPTFQPEQLLDENTFLQLRAELARRSRPRIYGGTGQVMIPGPITEETLNEVLEATSGMYYMGQRFIPDSYAFQRLVGMPYTGSGTPFTLSSGLRAFPRGLDFMSLLGSVRAADILRHEGDLDYQGYDQRYAELEEFFAGLTDAQWHRNLYWGWLHAMKALLIPPGEGYPSFMGTRSWVDKQLNTALCSWTELRHDTILYARQSYGATSAPPQEQVVGYVEPVPELWARLLALTRMTREGLASLGALEAGGEGRYRQLEEILDRLLNITIMELENQPLIETHYRFIENFADYIENIMEDVDPRSAESPMVADVFTDIGSGRVLEEATGYLATLLVAYLVPDGRILLGAGAKMSYYEFLQPIGQRLTDSAWKTMLQGGTQPSMPSWIESFWSSTNELRQTGQ